MINLAQQQKQPHCWVVCASVDRHYDDDLDQLLTEQECLKANRFRQPADRRRYLLAHGLKHLMLSAHLAQPRTHLRYDLGSKGKPYCTNTGAPFFNLSHSGDWVIIGLCSVAEVGVDVELLSRRVSASVAESVLSPSQQQRWRCSADPVRQMMVFWTQKEAVCKALGLGLSMGLETIDCSGALGCSLLHCGDQSLAIESRIGSDGALFSMASAHKLSARWFYVEGIKLHDALACQQSRWELLRLYEW